MSTTLTGLLLILFGVLSMVGAVLNWGIVSRPGKLLNRILGDTAARVVYFVTGAFLFFMGVGQLIGASWA